jgi:hypothetical protein
MPMFQNPWGKQKGDQLSPICVNDNVLSGDSGEEIGIDNLLNYPLTLSSYADTVVCRGLDFRQKCEVIKDTRLPFWA